MGMDFSKRWRKLKRVLYPMSLLLLTVISLAVVIYILVNYTVIQSSLSIYVTFAVLFWLTILSLVSWVVLHIRGNKHHEEESLLNEIRRGVGWLFSSERD